MPIGTNFLDVSRHYPDAMLFDMRNFEYNGTFAHAEDTAALPHAFTFICKWGPMLTCVSSFLRKQNLLLIMEYLADIC